MASRPATIDEFTEKVKELYDSDPEKVRLVLKYRHTDGIMTLRATNDELWLIYKTDQASEMRRLEAMQLWVTAAMCGASLESLTQATAAEGLFLLLYLSYLSSDDAEATPQHTTTSRRRGKKSKRK